MKYRYESVSFVDEVAFRIVRLVRMFGRVPLDWLDKKNWSGPVYPLLLTVLPRDEAVRRRYVAYTSKNQDLLGLCEAGLRSKSGWIHRNIIRETLFSKKDYLLFLFTNFKDPSVARFVEAHAREIEAGYRDIKGYEELIFGAYKIEPAGSLGNLALKSARKRGALSEFKFHFPELVMEKRRDDCLKILTGETTIFEFEKVKVIGGAQVLNNDSLILYEEAAHPKQYFVAGIWPYTMYSEESGKALIRYEATKAETIKGGILLGGRSSSNFFHWLIEYMPRFYDIHNEEDLRGVPLLVPDGLYRQMYEVISVLNIYGAEVIRLREGTVYNVAQLFIPSLHSNIVDDLDIEFWRSSGYSVNHLKYLRESVLAKRVDSKQKSGGSKLFLSRKSGGARGLSNSSEIEDAFVQNGFRIIYPEELSFLEQVNEFHNASIVAGPGGAAFANIIFCKPGATIVVLVSEIYKEICLFSNLAIVANFEYFFLTGSIDKSESDFVDYLSYATSDFSVPMEKVRYFLEQNCND